MKRRKHKKKLRIQEKAAQNGEVPQEATRSDPVSEKQSDDEKIQRESTESPTPNNSQIKSGRDERYSEEATENTKVDKRNEQHKDDIKQVSFSEKETPDSLETSEEEVKKKESESEANKPSPQVKMKEENTKSPPTSPPTSPLPSARATSPTASSPPLSPRVTSSTPPPRSPSVTSPIASSPPLSPTSPTTSPPLSPTSVKDDTDPATNEPLQGKDAGRSDTDDKAESGQAETETQRVETEETNEHSDIKPSRLCYIANTEVYEGDEVETPEGRKMQGLAAKIKSYQQAKDILDELKGKFTDSDSDRVPYACRYPTATSISEHFDSNGVHGAGLELLRLLVDRKVKNVAVFVLIKKEEDSTSYDNEVRHIVKCAEDVFVSLPKD